MSWWNIVHNSLFCLPVLSVWTTAKEAFISFCGRRLWYWEESRVCSLKNVYKCFHCFFVDIVSFLHFIHHAWTCGYLVNHRGPRVWQCPIYPSLYCLHGQFLLEWLLLSFGSSLMGRGRSVLFFQVYVNVMLLIYISFYMCSFACVHKYLMKIEAQRTTDFLFSSLLLWTIADRIVCFLLCYRREWSMYLMYINKFATTLYY